MLLVMTTMACGELLNPEVTYPPVTADYLTALYDVDNAPPNGVLFAEAYTDNDNPDNTGCVQHSSRAACARGLPTEANVRSHLTFLEKERA